MFSIAIYNFPQWLNLEQLLAANVNMGKLIIELELLLGNWGNIYTEDMTDSYRRHRDDTKTRKRNTKKLTDIKELNSRLNYINVNLEHLHNATERIMSTK